MHSPDHPTRRISSPPLAGNPQAGPNPMGDLARRQFADQLAEPLLPGAADEELAAIERYRRGQGSTQ